MHTETENPSSAETSAEKNSYSTRQLMKVAEMLERNGTTGEQFDRVLASGLLADIFDAGADLGNRKGVRAALKLRPLPGDHHLVAPDGLSILVDRGLTLEQMILDGKYEWINSDINPQQFPIQGEGQKAYETKLFHFKGAISSEDAQKQIWEADTTRPWQPAQIEHLLAFGAKYPDEQRQHPIVALGSVGSATFFGRRNVPYLYRRVVGRSLHLDWWNNEWQPIYRFLAVREAV